MPMTFGNANDDGMPFNSWFLGDLENWRTDTSAPSPKPQFGLRQSRVVEIKWGAHGAGDVRREWASCSDRITLSLLVRGQFLLRFRSPGSREKIIERRLEREGDYAIWGTGTEHTWVVEEDAVVLTVRWRE
jgi:hypothetical protein